MIFPRTNLRSAIKKMTPHLSDQIYCSAAVVRVAHFFVLFFEINANLQKSVPQNCKVVISRRAYCIPRSLWAENKLCYTAVGDVRRSECATECELRVQSSP